MLALLLTLLAQDAKVDGDWYGALEVMGTKLRIVVHLTKGADGAFTGTLDSPDQSADGFKIEDITFADGTLKFKFKLVGGAYEGKLSADGAKIDGKWTQGGQTPPLVFGRTPPEPPKRPQVPKKPLPYDEEEVAYENAAAEGVKLAGTLTLPRGAGPHPAVVLVTGSGPQDRDESLAGHKPFLVLADHLTRAGVAVLRADDRGVGKSTGRFGEATSEDFASDALAGVSYLRTRKEIHPAKIGLCGHSEGGLVAPMCAVKSGHVAFIVLMAGPGLPGDQILLVQSRLIGKASGLGDEAVAKNAEVSRRIYAVLREEKDNAAAEKKILEIVGELDAATRTQYETQVRTLTSPWLRFFISYDPAATLAKVKCPVLAVNGEKDLQVPCKEDLDAIEAALKAGGHARYKCVAFPNLNHLFQTCKTGSPTEYAQIEETFAPVALETISKWIVEVTR